MRALIQRVLEATVLVGTQQVGGIRAGLLAYIAVSRDDTDQSAAWIAEKIRYLRVFPDTEGKLNLDVVQSGGEILAVSAFTLLGSAQKGRRPSFDLAAGGQAAEQLYDRACSLLSGYGPTVQRGVFGADMKVHSINDGPVCILIDSASGRNETAAV